MSIPVKNTSSLMYIDTIPIGIVQQNRDGIITACNVAFEKLFNLDREFITGRTFQSLGKKMINTKGAVIPGDELPGMITLRTKEALRNIVMGVEKAGSDYCWVSANCEPVFDTVTGELAAVNSTFSDTGELNREITTTEKMENFYHEMIDSIEDYAILMIDNNGIVRNWNKGAERIKGYSRDEIIGKDFRVFYLDQDLAADLPGKLLKEALANGRATDEGWRVKKDGSLFWATVVITTVYNADNEIIGYSKITRDITGKRIAEEKIREAKDLMQLFLKHAPAAIAMLDRNLNYILVSEQWYNDYELTGMDIIGKNHYEVFPEIMGMPEWIEIHRQCLSGTISKSEKELFPRKDGTKQWIQWEIHPWKEADGSIGGLIFFTEIITDRIEAEEKLNQLNERLAGSNLELEQFAYIASHDLQEPLRMVSSFLKLLEKKYRADLDETAHQYIDFAVSGAERMKVLIDDLLKFSKVNSKQFSKGWVNCQSVVDNALNLYSQRIDSMKIVIHPGLFPTILANKIQIDQLFQNIIGNAIKYSSTERQPTIYIGCIDENEYWKFYVKDNGIGIDERYFEKIFVIFEQLHGSDEYDGTGIGLAVCRKIVELHDGKIWVESVKGEGSTFYFTIPK